LIPRNFGEIVKWLDLQVPNLWNLPVLLASNVKKGDEGFTGNQKLVAEATFEN
jgi:hypothetical protein